MYFGNVHAQPQRFVSLLLNWSVQKLETSLHQVVVEGNFGRRFNQAPSRLNVRDYLMSKTSTAFSGLVYTPSAHIRYQHTAYSGWRKLLLTNDNHLEISYNATSGKSKQLTREPSP